MNLNKAFILGRVTKDPEMRNLPSGQQVANFGMATNRYYTDSSGQKQEAVEFHNVVAFGKSADIISRYVNKGALLLVEGRIQTRNWNNQQGQKQYKTEIVVESLQLGPKSSGATGNLSNYQKPFTRPEPNKNDEIPVIEEKLPVIEENYTPPTEEPSQQDQQISFADDKASDEIDVKDIPF